MTFKHRWYSISASVALHLGLALSLIFSYFASSPAPSIGLDTGVTIHSYVVLNPNAKPNLSSPARPKAITQPIATPLPVTQAVPEKSADEDEDLTQTSPTPKATTPANTNDSAAQTTRGQNPNTLLAMLHNAILATQHYPASALNMKRHGTVQVGFTLSPAGLASDIAVTHSSGTSSLDQAAVQAIQQASPFQGIAPYIRQDTHYSIDVVFTLPP